MPPNSGFYKPTESLLSRTGILPNGSHTPDTLSHTFLYAFDWQKRWKHLSLPDNIPGLCSGDNLTMLPTAPPSGTLIFNLYKIHIPVCLYRQTDSNLITYIQYSAFFLWASLLYKGWLTDKPLLCSPILSIFSRCGHAQLPTHTTALQSMSPSSDSWHCLQPPSLR